MFVEAVIIIILIFIALQATGSISLNKFVKDYCKNNGYEFHIGTSLVGKINYPDLIVFDLDPDKDVSLDRKKELAYKIKNRKDMLN